MMFHKEAPTVNFPVGMEEGQENPWFVRTPDGRQWYYKTLHEANNIAVTCAMRAAKYSLAAVYSLLETDKLRCIAKYRQ